MPKTRRRRSTIDCRCSRLIDWLTFRTKKINNWLSFSQTHDHFRWPTMRIVKVRCNHRLQRENFRLTIFFWLAYFYEWSGDFLLTRVPLRVIWRFSFEHSRTFTSDEDFVSTRFLYEQMAVFFNLAYLYERIWRFYFAYSRTSTSNLFRQGVWAGAN